ncbi:hypothetical protein D9M73_121010 [compost metagenome]
MRLLEGAGFVLILGDGQPRGLAFAQQLERLAQHRSGDLGVFVALRRLLQQIGDALFEAFEVGQHQFGLDRLGIGDRIDLAFDMGDVVILEAAQHMHDRVDFADIAEELVAEAFALGRAAHQPGNVDKAQLRLDDLLRSRDRGEFVEPGVGHRDVADVRLDRAERIVRRLRRRGLRQRIEQGGLADIGQPDDSTAKTHDDP